MVKKGKEHKNISWLTNHFNYYNDYLFSSIYQSDNFDLSVYHKTMVLESHPWNENSDFTYKSYLLSEKIFGTDWKVSLKAFFSDSYFIIGGWNFPTYILIISLLTIRNKPFAVFTDTPKLPNKSLRHRLKISWLKFVFRKKSKATLLVTGEKGINVLNQLWGIRKDKMRNFPFATNNEFFAPSQNSTLDLNAEQLRFLSVGRIDFPHKGQDIALAAFDILKRRGYKFEYFIAGAGEDMEKLKLLITSYGLEENIHLLGWKQIHELPELFANTHFTIHSSMEDPFPNAILESLSCGTPVIGSDKAGSATDRIIPGINGFIHRAGDPTDLANNIQSAIRLTKEEYQEMRKKCREMALKWGVEYNLKVLQQILFGHS